MQPPFTRDMSHLTNLGSTFLNSSNAHDCSSNIARTKSRDSHLSMAAASRWVWGDRVSSRRHGVTGEVVIRMRKARARGDTPCCTDSSESHKYCGCPRGSQVVPLLFIRIHIPPTVLHSPSSSRTDVCKHNGIYRAMRAINRAL